MSVNGFSNMSIGADLRAFYLVKRLETAGQQKYRYVREIGIPLDFLAHFIPVFTGHYDIGEDKIGLYL